MISSDPHVAGLGRTEERRDIITATPLAAGLRRHSRSRRPGAERGYENENAMLKSAPDRSWDLREAPRSLGAVPDEHDAAAVERLRRGGAV